MKHNAPTPTQVHAADPQRIVELMTSKPPVLPKSYMLPHPHMVCNSWVGPRIKGVVQCH
jgi:hypothetical protein